MDDSLNSQSQWVAAALERFEQPLISHAFRVLGDFELARDVVQDTFLKLCSQKREEVGGHLAEWLYTVCRNGAVDLKRRRRATNLDDASLDTFAGEPAAPIDAAEIGESCAALRATLQKLTPREQEVLRLRFQGGLSYKEIAGVTGQSVSHVGFLIHVGIQKLRAKLTKTQAIPRLGDYTNHPRKGLVQP
ncbi:MAG: sigma-70 family RNA polymerase sigma factor [Planctomycetes bacterium]|nr:sigma-70 family RNA polymerase sigma factor [Planctomycetota bacterium]